MYTTSDTAKLICLISWTWKPDISVQNFISINCGKWFLPNAFAKKVDFIYVVRSRDILLTLFTKDNISNVHIFSHILSSIPLQRKNEMLLVAEMKTIPIGDNEKVLHLWIINIVLRKTMNFNNATKQGLITPSYKHSIYVWRKTGHYHDWITFRYWSIWSRQQQQQYQRP